MNETDRKNIQFAFEDMQQAMKLAVKEVYSDYDKLFKLYMQRIEKDVEFIQSVLKRYEK